jgi:VWFA-related protein
MSMIRHTFNLVVILVAASIAAVGAPAQTSRDYRFPYQPGDNLVVQNDFGRVRVEAWEEPEVQITVRAFANEESRIKNVSVNCQKVSSRIFAQAYFYDYSAESVYIDVRAPKTLDLVIWGANPAVELTGMSGWARAHTMTGFISARDLTGSTSLLTESGDISLNQSIQPVADLRLESIQGNVDCHLAEGLNLRGWLRAGRKASWNGDIEILQGALERQLGVGGPVFLAASSQGNVLVRIDKPTVASLPPQPAPRTSPAPAARTEQPSPAPVRYDPPSNQEPPTRRRGADSPGETPPPAATQPVNLGTADTAGTYSLKVAVDWVYVHASVRDRYNNRAVPNLTRDDFEVLEDGRHQEIEQFDSTEAPFSLLLLLDVSGSTKSYLRMIQEASIQFTRLIKPSDRIAVASFNSRTRLHQEFTNDRRQVAEAIHRLRSGGGTAFYDALDESVSRYMDGVEGRKAIVVFTDGVDNRLTGDFSEGSTIGFQDLYREIQEEDTLIYTIFLDTEGDPGNFPMPRRRNSIGGILGDIILGPGGSSGGGMGIPGGSGSAYEEARRELQEIADQTGGRMYAPRSINDLGSVYQEIANDLRVQYTLGYHSMGSPSPDRWHKIEVRVIGHPDLSVRARRGYYVGHTRP